MTDFLVLLNQCLMFFSLHPSYIAGGLISWIVNPGVQWHMLKK